MKRLIITLFVFSFVFVGCYNTGTTIDKGGCIDGDCVNGYGSFSWTDNYEGEWADGKRNGKGTMNWSDGTKYVGDWKDDKRDGHGAYTYGTGEWEGDHYDGGRENLLGMMENIMMENGRMTFSMVKELILKLMGL